MEELDFFEEICLTSLYATKAVKFAAVVDSNGKMVTGKIRRIHGFGREGSTKMTNTSKSTGRCYSFYHHYLIPSLNNKATICWLDWTSSKTHFEITEIAKDEDNNSKMLLAVTPLTQTKDKFLCIYLQMPLKASNQHQQIMSKLCDAIQ
ncbi:MAG TPA: hypothetical protein VFI73_00555 [Candidatus Nitrosopolaris sp.]|nr:hypothetical protein [Candidatus Nitrosopolaris sp.]